MRNIHQYLQKATFKYGVNNLMARSDNQHHWPKYGTTSLQVGASLLFGNSLSSVFHQSADIILPIISRNIYSRFIIKNRIFPFFSNHVLLCLCQAILLRRYCSFRWLFVQPRSFPVVYDEQSAETPQQYSFHPATLFSNHFPF